MWRATSIRSRSLLTSSRAGQTGQQVPGEVAACSCVCPGPARGGGWGVLLRSACLSRVSFCRNLRPLQPGAKPLRSRSPPERIVQRRVWGLCISSNKVETLHFRRQTHSLTHSCMRSVCESLLVGLFEVLEVTHMNSG